MYLKRDASGRGGAMASLQVPSVDEAEGNKLDPSLTLATVVIPNYDGKVLNDRITMHWDGRTEA